MKVRLLKDWNFDKAGAVVDVFEPLAIEWVHNGTAARFNPQEETVERAETTTHARSEKAMKKHTLKR